MSNFLPLTPAQSWALVGMVMIGAILLTYLIYGFDCFLNLAIWNCKITGVKGVFYAIRGMEAYEILRERVIEVSRTEGGLYSVTTSDTERNYKYFVITSTVDEDNPDYDDAIRLSGSNEVLKKALLPESRVKNYFVLKNRETGEETEFFVVYVNFNNTKTVETAMNKFFDEEFHNAARRARQESA